ncbi:MAG: hypothetical protein A2Y41_03695 [Spirochaetes bacterium GWB1_36_13]|nr:MAG: hypothetical protein A2Y41_03695 [Spirochaetes bacterium GWB1_36_13]
MKKKLQLIVFLFMFLFITVYAADVQDEVTDTTLQNTYSIKDGSVISASNLRTLFMKLVSGAWTANGTSISYNKGNVGIGTSNPTSPLQIHGNSAFGIVKAISLSQGSEASIGFAALTDAGQDYWVVGKDITNANTGDFHIYQNGIRFLIKKDTGNVGLGISNPLERLDVYGKIYLHDGNAAGVIHFPNSGTIPKFFIRSSDPNNTADYTDRLVIDGISGNVGIGTYIPLRKLHIVGNDSNGWAGIMIQNDTLSVTRHIVLSNDGILKIARTGAGDDFTINDIGNVGIGTTSPTEKLTVAGNIYASGTVTQASDFRYKKNIQALENPLEKILSLHGVSFEWKTEEYQDKHFAEGKTIGFIAQEAEKVVPEVVQTGKDGYKSMAYANITALLVEAVKELKRQNDEKIKEMETRMSGFEKENEALKLENEQLKNRLAAYESKIQKIDAMLINLNQKLR